MKLTTTIKRTIGCATLDLAGIVVTIIGLVNLLGHVFNHPESYTWTNNVPMAFPTAICFVIIGCGNIIISVLLAIKHQLPDK